MDLRSLELRVGQRLAVRLFDGGAESEAVLDRERLERVADAVRAFVGRLAAHGAVRVARVDAVARRAQLELDGGGAVELAGAAYEPVAAALQPLASAVLTELRPRGDDAAGGPSEASFWSHLYRSGDDRWELGRAAPPIVRWLDAHPPRGKRALVVGCGRGHEARLLARAGAEVVAIDFAADAIEAARELALRDGSRVDFRVRDLFALAADPERYDLLVEHTCFCAIDPARRDEYITVAAEVLVPGGELLGLFYAHGRPGGPPYTVDRAELVARFGRRFALVADEVPSDSAAQRQGQEILAQFRRS